MRLQSSMIVVDLTLAALRDRGTGYLPGYETALSVACDVQPPPYGMAWYGEKYRSVAVDPEWLARSLIANAAKEGEGATKLWSLAGRARDDAIREAVRLHAVDESRHARYYIALLDLAFPSAVDHATRSELVKLSPGYAASDQPVRQVPAIDKEIWDELIQMNIGEIRTRIHQLLLRPVIRLHCPSYNQNRLNNLLDSLLDDETRHIEYTAQLIELAYTKDPEFVRATMLRRMADFNEITLAEVGGSTFE